MAAITCLTLVVSPVPSGWRRSEVASLKQEQALEKQNHHGGA
jgi:hypothetical protein